MAARDVLFIVAAIFILAIGFIAVHYVVGGVVTKIIAIPEVASNGQAVEGFQSSVTSSNRMDYVVLCFTIGAVLALIISAYLIGGSPVFMFIYFIIIVIIVAISTYLANLWEQMTTTPPFSSSLAAFPITNHILLHLPIYAAIFGFIGIVVMFAKPLISPSQELGGYQ